MFDPLVGPSGLSSSDSLSNCKHPDVSYCYTETHSDNANDIGNLDCALEVFNHNGSATSCDLSSERSDAYKFMLEKDVQKLQQRLQEEVELHAILENAVGKSAVKFSSSTDLPHQALEILSSLAMLESMVSKLEEELISLHFQLSQERNERRLAEYRWKHSSVQSLFLCSDSARTSKADNEVGPLQEERDSVNINSICCQLVEDGTLTREAQPESLWDHPCKLSEQMVRCMKNIFISLVDYNESSKLSLSESHCTSVSPSVLISSEQSILPSWVRNPQVDLHTDVLAVKDTCDPYRVLGKLSWADVGNYGLATEVSWMSVGKKQLEYAAGALRRYRKLVEQLAQVNPINLSSNKKLSFWINLYNALIMHAYLAYGVPRSDLKFFSLMRKAAYTVGGHSFSAAVIEYVLLKMKPPVHRPQISLLLAIHKLKVSEEQKKFAIAAFEPLVAFALSCGMYSSPAIRIYSAKNVREELQEAQRDFIRASVGVSSKGKLLVPKMLQCFAKGVVDDENLAVWISHYLPLDQAAFVEKSAWATPSVLTCYEMSPILTYPVLYLVAS